MRALCLLAMLWAAAPAMAGGGFYFGAKGAALIADEPDPRIQMGNDLNVGGVLGYGFGEVFAIEGEATTTVSGGEVDILGYMGEWEMTTISMFAVMRTTGAMYGMAKIGRTRANGEATVAGVSAAAVGSSNSLGAGIGYRSGAVSFEVDFVKLAKDMNMLGVGVRFAP